VAVGTSRLLRLVVAGFDGELLLVACGGGTLLGIRSLQPEGRRIQTAADAVHGRVLRPGDRIESVRGA
jgi:methionyl-tRNA formyltransferase